MLQGILNVIINYYPLLLKGLGVTLALSAITVFFGAIIGMLVTFLTMSKNIIFRFIGKAYVEVIRGVPLFLQIFLFYTILTDVDVFITVAIALIINSGAYVAEIIRGGIQAVDKGQNEAARSLGLSKFQTMRKIIFPQAIKNILPAIGNEYVTIIKETSLGSAFFVGELMTVQKYIGNYTYDFLSAYIVVALFYFVSTFTLSKLIGRIERKINSND